MLYLDDCLKRDVLFFTGKGGVGKSTLAWATALACSRKGKKIKIVSWNPLERDLKWPGIQYQTLTVPDCFREYVTRALKFETLYSVIFENHVLQSFIRATPGLAETVIAGKIWDLWSHREQDILIVDLPASGHAASFFQSPLGVSKVFDKGFIHGESEKILSLFTAKTTRLDLVTLPQELPVLEVLELHQKLKTALPLPFGFLHLNQVEPERKLPPKFSSALSNEIANCVESYYARKGLEAESLKDLKGLELPILSIPQLPEETMQQNREAVADYLESLG